MRNIQWGAGDVELYGGLCGYRFLFPQGLEQGEGEIVHAHLQIPVKNGGRWGPSVNGKWWCAG